MKLTISKNQINTSIETFLRRAGFAFIHDRKTGKNSFVKKLGRNFYPRLHMYVKTFNDKIIFNLHLDQKKPSYRGQRMHSAEYDGKVVEQEIERLKSLVNFDLTKLDYNKNLDESIDAKKNSIDQEKLEKEKIFLDRMMG